MIRVKKHTLQCDKSNKSKTFLFVTQFEKDVFSLFCYNIPSQVIAFEKHARINVFINFLAHLSRRFTR